MKVTHPCHLPFWRYHHEDHTLELAVWHTRLARSKPVRISMVDYRLLDDLYRQVVESQFCFQDPETGDMEPSNFIGVFNPLFNYKATKLLACWTQGSIEVVVNDCSAGSGLRLVWINNSDEWILVQPA